MIKTNLDSIFLGSKYLVHDIIKRNYGKIIDICSGSAVIASSNLSIYAAGKDGVVHLTKALAVELSKHNKSIYVILPGNFDTKMTRSIIKNPITYDRFARRTPMNWLGTLDELIDTVVFLASDASHFVVGEAFAIDRDFVSFGVGQNLEDTWKTIAWQLRCPDKDRM